MKNLSQSRKRANPSEGDDCPGNPAVPAPSGQIWPSRGSDNGQICDRIAFRLPRALAIGNLATMEGVMYSWESEVRDYECDLQGIVNNATYQNYLEHARHLFLKAKGIDFAEVTARGIYLIVVRVEIDYRVPARALLQY